MKKWEISYLFWVVLSILMTIFFNGIYYIEHGYALSKIVSIILFFIMIIFGLTAQTMANQYKIIEILKHLQ